MMDEKEKPNNINLNVNTNINIAGGLVDYIINGFECIIGRIAEAILTEYYKRKYDE